MEFKDWYNEQWLKIYHPRIHEQEDLSGKNEVDIAVLKRRARTLRHHLQNMSMRIFGNGKPGFVREVVKEAVSEMEDNLTTRMKLAVKEAIDEKFEKRDDKASMKLWDIAKEFIRFAQAILMAYIAWKFFSS